MNEQMIRQWFSGSHDVKFYEHTSEYTGLRTLLVYCDGLCDTKFMNEFVLSELDNVTSEGLSSLLVKKYIGNIMLEPVAQPWKKSELSSAIFSGYLLLYFINEQLLAHLNIQRLPQRKPEDSNMENSARGARDGFVEELATNAALIRKRLATTDLRYEEIKIGNIAPTKTGLLYLESIKDRPYIEEARNRLLSLDIDTVLGIAQIEELLSDSPYTLFPLVTYTGRPDFAVECLLKERFIIIVDGNPSVIIAPVNLMLLIKSPEDAYLSYAFVMFTRLIRICSLWVSIALPGFWVSLCEFNQDQLPFPLLATITLARQGLPLSAPMEMFLTLLLLELFREASARLPSSIGQAITVVGGFIIGEAAILSGLISPSMVVISAITAVATSTLINLNLAGIVVLVRLGIFLICSIFGMFGFILCLIFLVWHLSNLRSFGLPYLAPLSPLNPRDVLSALLIKPRKNKNKNKKPFMFDDFKRRDH
ncbi:spore germination protein [Paenibacillus eucommiae]|uniref:Spore germination protein n=1 Tax=Paenibacillus eucommiae TaxID=1355755 RepID=A0ABS4IYF1_9BACL|nr:spore germination protein [Paenibacillus eucommiae]MBP1991901.1 hypothetical protein [Paenibacillus eucommiae]